MIRCRWWMVLCGATLGLVPAGVAQATPQGSGAASTNSDQNLPVFHANVNLVLVDVVVRDKGKPVHGLKATDFHVLEDGKEQRVTTFEEHTAADAVEASKAPVLPPDTYTNAPRYHLTSAANVLLLDALNTPMQDQMWVRQKMLHYLHMIPPGTQIAVFTLASRLRMVAGFTTDVGTIERALSVKQTPVEKSTAMDAAGDQAEKSVTDEITAELPAAQAAAMAQEVKDFEGDRTKYRRDVQVSITVAALDELGRYLSTIPGRKNLIWFSGGFPISFVADASRADRQQFQDYSTPVLKMEEMLAQARVAVYPVDARGLMTAPLFGDGGMDAGALPENAVANDVAFLDSAGWPQVTLREIARQTGGQAFVNTNGIGRAVEQAIADGSNYYTLGYAPKNTNDNGDYRAITVRLDGSGYELAYRRGYYAESPGKRAKPTALIALSPMGAAMMHGAPPLSQLIFDVRVLSTNEAEEHGVHASPGPAGALAKNLKGPVERRLLDYLVDPRSLTLATLPDGRRQADLEVWQSVYSADGVLLNYVDQGLRMHMSANWAGRPMHVRQEIDVPVGEVDLRMGVRDVMSGRIGTLEIPLRVAPK